ncbi:MAG: hypothetical protein WDN72_03890 [Alphaproteobacteria bacterium]
MEEEKPEAGSLYVPSIDIDALRAARKVGRTRSASEEPHPKAETFHGKLKQFLAARPWLKYETLAAVWTDIDPGGPEHTREHVGSAIYYLKEQGSIYPFFRSIAGRPAAFVEAYEKRTGEDLAPRDREIFTKSLVQASGEYSARVSARG